MVWSATCHLLCVQKVESVVHNTLIEHGVQHQLPYALRMEYGGCAVCNKA